MARPRIVRVEHKLCPPCERHPVVHAFQGDFCTLCGRLFDPKSMCCVARDRMIVTDCDPPDYEQVRRGKCTQCGNLFAVAPERAITCGQCGGPVLSWQALEVLWKRRAANTATPARERDRWFVRTRDIAWFVNTEWETPSRRAELVFKALLCNGVAFTTTGPLRPICHSCERPAQRLSFCPLCRSKGSDTACLPQNPTHVWKRVGPAGFDRNRVALDWDSGRPQPVVIASPPTR